VSPVPVEGSLWERSDEVFRVESVYEARQRLGDNSFAPVTLVKAVVVEPMPSHWTLDRFLEGFTPYDPEAE
jgi:hypothetical protein